VKSAESADEVGPLAAEAVAASHGPPGGPVTLILPADTAWTETNTTGPKSARPRKGSVDEAAIVEAEKRIRAAKKPVILLGSGVITPAGLAAAGRLGAKGLRVLTDTFIARQPRGAGRFAPDRMMYFGEMALADLEGVDLMVLVETVEPVAFFAYPDRPSVLVPEGCETLTLADRSQDGAAALAHLGDRLGAPAQPAVQDLALPDPQAGPLTPAAAGAAIARHLPEGAVISDDSVTSGQPILNLSRTARPHDWLGLTGGAIGQGVPLAVGAAVASPGRKVVSLNGDGAAAYTIQGLWSLAREGLDVTVVIFANNVYRILGIELGRTGAGNPGPAAGRLLSLGDPNIDWVSLSKGLGVPAVRCETAEAFDAAFARCMAEPGPHLIEAALP